MQKGFYQQSAIEKLSTPEKLDQLIKVINYKAWFSLLFLSLLLLSGLLWAVFGTIKTKLDVVGVVVGSELHDVVSTTNGQLIELKVKIGDIVEKDDIVAIIKQPDIYQQLEDARVIVKDSELELEQLLSYGTQGTKLQNDLSKYAKQNIDLEIEAEKEKLEFLKLQLASESALLKQGLITLSQVENTKQLISTSKNAINRLKKQIIESNNNLNDFDFDIKKKISLQKNKIAEARRNLLFIEEKYDEHSNVRSAYSGEVIEILIDRGIVVNTGTPFFKLKHSNTQSTNTLTGVFYIPSNEGKRIKKQMEALVVPSTIKAQEFGYITGKIKYVSDFPVTQMGMLTSVKNEQFVKGLLNMGALYEVHIDLDKDTNTFSGYRWTSVNGPEIKLQEGTSCSGKITIKEERPIAIVIPALKKFFDLY